VSTHLEHGYRIAAGTDIPAFLERVRVTLDPVRDRLDARRLAVGATQAIDDANTNATIYRDPPLSHAYLEYVEEQLHADARSAWQDPNRLSLAISTNPTDGWHGVLLFAAQREFHEAFQAVAGVESYSYWNHTDRPEALTEAAWAVRRTWWDLVLPTGVPAATCDPWSLRTGVRDGLPAVFGNPTLVATQVPNLQWRARRLAQAAVANAAIRGVQDTNTILSIVMRSMHTDRYSEVVDAAIPLLVTVDEDVLTGVTIPEPANLEGHRAAFTTAAAAAGAQLAEREDANQD